MLLNVLTNAIDYAPDTDRIDVRLRQEDSWAVVEIQDYGPGVRAPELPELFTRFHGVGDSNPAPQSGLGLGLFLSRELVTAHGGTIDLASKEGEGVVVVVRLPLAD
jgi:signal transduction histidine kinase